MCPRGRGRRDYMTVVGSRLGSRHCQKQECQTGPLTICPNPDYGYCCCSRGISLLLASGFYRRELPVLDPMRPVGLGAQPAVAVGLVVLVVPFEPLHAAVAFEGEHVRGDAVEEPPVVADDHHAAGKSENGVLEGPQRVDVEIVGRLVEQQQVAAALEELREVHAVAFAAGQRTHLALLVAALEVEPRHVGPRRDFTLAEHHLVAAVRNLLPDGLVGVERIARLVHISDLDGFAEAQRAGIGLLLPGDHPEERRLARTVGPDDADDAAARQREVDLVHQEHVTVALAESPRLDDDVAEPRARRDVDFGAFDALGGLFRQHGFVRVEARLALRLPRARGHPDPVQLALERPLAPRFLLLFDLEALLLLFEPGRIVALPRNARAAIEFQDPTRDVVQEVPVVRDRDHRARVVLQKVLEPLHRLRIEVVGRLIEEQQVW